MGGEHEEGRVGGLPTGTLTFLMTDIEGSTPLWEQFPKGMRAAIVRHDALFDEILRDYHGLRIRERGEGDSVFIVFRRATDALAASSALQLALADEAWPDGIAIAVRMGLHSGDAELHDGSYYGATVNRTARIRSLAAAGQVLISRATHDLVQDALPAGLQLCSLGTHTLKGFSRSEEIYQVSHPSLPAQFPPLPSGRAIYGNVPRLLTSFVGRAQECAHLRSLLAEARLVTLVGSGGCGKTRVAIEVATAVAEAATARDGVWLVELAGRADERLVVPTVAAVLGVGDSRSGRDRGDPLVALVAALAGKDLLLVLDNCEHLIGACAELAGALVGNCPGIRILSTSREPLGVAGEVPWRLASLALPQATGSLAEVERAAAVQLFVQRARTARPGFALAPSQASTVAHICRRLDGIPLALELAAARLSSLSLETLAARLDDRFRLLTGGSRTALQRQQTLRATLDWSYALLTPAERTVLARLAVFAGGWRLEAAELVCSGDGVAKDDVLDLLSGLVNKSLVVAEEDLVAGESQTHYRLLETVRQYAHAQLGDDAPVRERHRDHYLALAERAAPELEGARQEIWLHCLEQEHDNLRAALAWCGGDLASVVLRLRLATALGRFWVVRNYCVEGQRWLGEPLPTGVPPDLEARVLMQRGLLVSCSGELQRGIDLLEQSAARYRALHDRAPLAGVLGSLSELLQIRGDCLRAESVHLESLQLYRGLGDRQGVGIALQTLGKIACELGQYGRARACVEEGLALFRELGSTWHIAACGALLGQVLGRQGHRGSARHHFEESRAIFSRLGARELVVQMYCCQAALACDEGDLEEAQALLARAGTLALSVEQPFVIGMVRAGQATVARLRGELEEARALLEQSLATVEQLGLRAGTLTIRNELALIACAGGHHVHAAALLRGNLPLIAKDGYQYLAVVALEGLARVAAATGQPARAASLIGAAHGLRIALSAPLPPVDQPAYERSAQAARAGCGEVLFRHCYRAGEALSFDEAVALATEEGDRQAWSGTQEVVLLGPEVVG